MPKDSWRFMDENGRIFWLGSNNKESKPIDTQKKLAKNHNQISNEPMEALELLYGEQEEGE